MRWCTIRCIQSRGRSRVRRSQRPQSAGVCVSDKKTCGLRQVISTSVSTVMTRQKVSPEPTVRTEFPKIFQRDFRSMAGAVPASWNSSFQTECQPKLTNPARNPKQHHQESVPGARKVGSGPVGRHALGTWGKKNRGDLSVITPWCAKISTPGRQVGYT